MDVQGSGEGGAVVPAEVPQYYLPLRGVTPSGPDSGLPGRSVGGGHRQLREHRQRGKYLDQDPPHRPDTRERSRHRLGEGHRSRADPGGPRPPAGFWGDFRPSAVRHDEGRLLSLLGSRLLRLGVPHSDHGDPQEPESRPDLQPRGDRSRLPQPSPGRLHRQAERGRRQVEEAVRRQAADAGVETAQGRTGSRPGGRAGPRPQDADGHLLRRHGPGRPSSDARSSARARWAERPLPCATWGAPSTRPAT